MLDRLSPARHRLVVGGTLLTLLAGVVALTFAATHRGPDDTDGTSVTEKAPPPVVLVPGYGGSTRALSVLADSLRDDGRFVRIVELGIASLGDLDRQADLVARTVDGVREDTGADDVDVVAFSAGGIATRLWVADKGGAAVAHRIITLGSPHHGTEVAGVGGTLAPKHCPAACRELTPDSDVIRSLDSGDETPSGPSWVSIWSEDDELVVPATSSELDGALSFSVQSICPDSTVTHQDLPSDPTVMAMVRHELGGDEPTEPDDSVCREAEVSRP